MIPGIAAGLAYLAATKEGRRIYLNRLLTDADVVIPVGRLGYDPILGHRGPWSVLFPELSDRATIEAHRGQLRGPDSEAAPALGPGQPRRVVRGGLAARDSVSRGSCTRLCRAR